MGIFRRDWEYHTNPDGSRGGQVFRGAQVDPSAFIGPTAVVLSGAKVGPGEIVKNGSIYTSDGHEVRFD